MKKDIYSFAKELWPINRSLTGEGNRKTLLKIKGVLKNLKMKSVKSGEKFFDWSIPKEWKVKEAYIINPEGKKICDFTDNNLHLVGYSHSINKKLKLSQLKKNLFFLKDQPEAVPYVTSYYNKTWGFSMSYNEYKNLKEGIYQVVIDSKLFNGKLDYGELIFKGKSKKEILLSTYICHPSMANNEISGISLLTFLSKFIISQKRFYTYRIIFIPETIGSIMYIKKNLSILKKRTEAGYILTCIGDERNYSILPSRNGDTISDKIGLHIIKWTDQNFKMYSWSERGSDERQFCAPGVDLPISSLMRTKYGCYPEYHTSLDKLGSVVTAKGLKDSLNFVTNIIKAFENNYYLTNKILCEPNMGKRGLYPILSKKGSINYKTKIMMEILTWADGKHSVLDVAEILNVPIWELYDSIKILLRENLIKVDMKKS